MDVRDWALPKAAPSRKSLTARGVQGSVDPFPSAQRSETGCVPVRDRPTRADDSATRTTHQLQPWQAGRREIQSPVPQP